MYAAHLHRLCRCFGPVHGSLLRAPHSFREHLRYLRGRPHRRALAQVFGCSNVGRATGPAARELALGAAVLEQATAVASPPAREVVDDGAQAKAQTETSTFCVVNFYLLVHIAEPQQEVEAHRQFLKDRDLRGRIYISGQGVNAQFGGPLETAQQYTAWVTERKEFKGLRPYVWPANGHVFPKMRLKFKPNLLSISCGMTNLSVTDPSARATPLSPSQWRDMLPSASQRDSQAPAPLVLDLRNNFEWDAGHFRGAVRPLEEEFRETPTASTDGRGEVPQCLQAAPKDAPIMMYCTGGIRCDVYSTFLRSRGFENLYSLEGGVQNFMQHEGTKMWDGSLFVFDGRMAVMPRDAGASGEGPAPLHGRGRYTLSAAGGGAPLPAAVPCQLCGCADAMLPHVNCANVDCNELFVACRACQDRLKGCCCEACIHAPRLLRPIQPQGGHYGTWGNYAQGADVERVMARGRSPVGRVARRQRRREAMAQRRDVRQQERQARKRMVKELVNADFRTSEAQHLLPEPQGFAALS